MPPAKAAEENAGWRPRAPVRKRRRWWTMLLGVGAFALAAALLHAPDFHDRRQAASTPEEAKELSRDCVRRSVKVLDAVLNGAARWEEEFPAETLNAWLAVDFAKQHAGALPRGAEAPVVEFADDRARIGFRWGFGAASTVVHATVRLWVPKNNLLAIQLHEVAAGAVPLPNAAVRQLVERAARSLGAEVVWRRHEGRQVALLRLTVRGFALQRAEVRDGILRVGGRAAGIASALRAAETAARR